MGPFPGTIIELCSICETHRMNIKSIHLLALLILLPFGVFSQDFVQGRLLDSISKTPVVFASIVLKGSSKGVISNEDGSFRIPVDFISEYDELTISSMGYATLTVPTDNLLEGKVNIVYVVPKTIELQEATVVGYKEKFSAKKIVRKAIRAIPENFSTNPFAIVGYYRDYQQDDSKYVNLNEAIVEIQDKGFNERDLKTTDFRIYRLVKNHEFPRDSISSRSYDYLRGNKVLEKGVLPAYNGNELVILRVHDAIRNYDQVSYSFIDEMKRDLLRNHDFTLADDVYLDGEWLYAIDFETKINDVHAKGHMMVSKKDFAIYGLQYEAYQLDRSKLIFEIHSEYRPYQGKMYLNYLSFSNSFKVKLPPVFAINKTSMDMDNRMIVIDFNQDLDLDSAKAPEHYELFFRKRNIPIQVLKVYGASKKVVLKPQFKSERIERLFYEAVENNQKGGADKIVCIVNGIKDAQGNILGASESKTYLQFREFFTQKVLLEDKVQGEGIEMDKNKPLFENKIPKETLDSVERYWMNTPLQEAINLRN